MEAAPLPPAGEGGAKRRVRARRSRCGESVAALTTGAPGANALGGKCPPASACGRRLFLDFAPKDIRTRVPAFTAAHERTAAAQGGTRQADSSTDGRRVGKDGVYTSGFRGPQSH